ncbi:MAG: hypothetical protein Ct9H90mP27_1900 [Gammaproteobacteria bacterium]|nr:MAG: hypothetical protein Ct9H90mP27_1900 [Gammaproteobacteria bacterium]
MQDAKGSELLMALGGNLDETLFSERGNRFAGNYYPRYMIDYALALWSRPLFWWKTPGLTMTRLQNC